MRVFVERMLHAIFLDAGLYREVASDANATAQALLVVVLAGLATGLRLGEAGPATAREVPAQIVLAFAGWAVATSAAYVIGTAALKPGAAPSSRWGSLGRALGFAQTPLLLRLLGLLPAAGLPVTVVTLVWHFVATVVAVGTALDLQGAWRALGVATPAFLLHLGALFALNLLV